MVLNYIWIAFFIIAFIIFPVAGSMQVVCYRWQDNRVYIGLPCRLTATATLMLPDGFFLLRIYMGAKVQKIVQFTQIHPSNFCNFLIFSLCYLMAWKGEKVRKSEESVCLSNYADGRRV